MTVTGVFSIVLVGVDIRKSGGVDVREPGVNCAVDVREPGVDCAVDIGEPGVDCAVVTSTSNDVVIKVLEVNDGCGSIAVVLVDDTLNNVEVNVGWIDMTADE